MLRCIIFTEKRQWLALALVAFVAGIATTSGAAGEAFPVRCVGRADAARRAIYLHGKRPITTPMLEAGLVAPLTQLAEKLGYRLAIPEATTLCEGEKATFCWRGERVESLARTWGSVTTAAAQCFPTGAAREDFGVIGFSNGGYHVAKVLMRGLTPRPQWAVSIGAAGNVALSEGASEKTKSVPLTIIAGKHDGVRAEAQALASNLAQRGFATEYREVEGGHMVPLAELEALMSRWGRVASR